MTPPPTDTGTPFARGDTEQVRGRLERQLHRRAKELGFEVVKAAEAGASDTPASVPPDPLASE